MQYIKTNSTSAAFYFAAEEYCMSNMTDEGVIMFWQTEKCIMLGSNQIAAAEINLDEATKHNVEIVRRPSGGGTIFTDGGTILISIIIPFNKEHDAKLIQHQFVEQPLTLTLNKMGVVATIKGRNDVLVDGKKISGIAQHLHNNMLCSHCSLLFDADFSVLQQVLNPDTEKMSLKGIKSVKSRVVNLKEHMNASLLINEFKENFIPLFLDNFQVTKQSEFNQSELASINNTARNKYLNSEWNFGKNIYFNYYYSHRFTLGQVELFLQIEDGYIQYCKIKGDFLNIKPIEYIEQRLQHIPYTPNAVKEAVDIPNIVWYLGGIKVSDFLYCFFAK